jgi:2-amino-4-hydroxy-6-hydroxymethyldihydropteridine diphosphokinase
MARVYVGVGSNFDRERNIRSCLHLLEQRFRELDVSPIYDSPPVDNTGAHYFNLVTGFDTAEPVDAVFSFTKQIEGAIGRTHATPASDVCAIDVDLLLYDELVIATERYVLPRPDILRYPFVLRPLADIAPRRCHPQTGTTYLELWTQIRSQRSALRDVSHQVQWARTDGYGQPAS